VTDTATVVLALTQAMEAAITAAIASTDTNSNVLVDWGYPMNAWPNDMILIMGARTKQAVATMGTNRSRRESIDLDVHFLCWRTTQREAVAAAYGWLRLVDRQARMIDPTLGGVCQNTGCVVTATDSDGYTNPANTALGRGCEIRVTFTASDVRISG
jgi:hypothetical protein